MLGLEAVDLAEADPVLAGAGAAARERVLDEQLDQLVRPPHLVGVVRVDHQREVDVPVPGVPDDPGDEPAPLELPPRERDRRRELARAGRRRRSSGGCFPGAAAAAGVGGRVTRGPEARARGRVALGDDVERALGLGDRGDELEVGRDRRLAPRPLRRRATGPAGKAVPWYALIAAIVQRVEELDPRDAGAGRDDRRRRAARGLDVGEGETRATTACSGMPWRRSVSSVITPSVPSEPISRPSRSYPADVFGARLPARTTRPPASTASSASTLARIFP